MEKKYFKSIEISGEVYMQFRYYSPMSDDKCYEAVIILISPTGLVKEIVESYSKTDFEYFQRNYISIDSDEFTAIQENKIFRSVGTRKKLYDIYYNQWKDYYLAKKQALENVRLASSTFNFDYYDRLAREWINTGVNVKKDGLKKLDDAVKEHSGISQTDIYREARHNATLDYVANRI